MNEQEVLSLLAQNPKFKVLSQGLPNRWQFQFDEGVFLIGDEFHVQMERQYYGKEPDFEEEDQNPRGYLKWWKDGSAEVIYYDDESGFAGPNPASRMIKRAADHFGKLLEYLGFDVTVRPFELRDFSSQVGFQQGARGNLDNFVPRSDRELDMMEMFGSAKVAAGEPEPWGAMFAKVAAQQRQATEEVDLGSGAEWEFNNWQERFRPKSDADAVPPMRFLFSEDWSIYASDSYGVVYAISTEMSPIWLRLPEGADTEEDAVEKYIVPELLSSGKFNDLAWRLVVDEKGQAVSTEDFMDEALPYLRDKQPYDRWSKSATQEPTWNFLPYMKEIGEAYANYPDNSGDPAVQSAWRSLADDSMARAARLDQQYDTRVVNFEPYETPEQQDYDVRNYNQFLVSDQNSDHPLWSVEENVAFRKVHDLMGHLPSYGDFSWEGENRACGEHFKLLSREARQALFVECIMQTAAVNVYSKFLDQKCFIHPNFDPDRGWIPMGDPQDYDADAGVIYRGITSRWQKEAMPAPTERELEYWDNEKYKEEELARKDVELVPTQTLMQMLDYDRRKDTKEVDPERWEALKNHIAQNGFTNPLVLEYHVDDKTVHIGEGNHRVLIADELGIEYIPCRVYASTRKTHWMEYPAQGPEEASPGWALSPSDIGLPTKTATIKQAGWKDYVEPKAKRLKDEGKVRLIRNGIQNIVAEVQGDNGTYQVEIDRIDPNSQAITGWTCECPWYDYAFGRTRQFKKFEGRLCSHAMAAFWQSQASPLDEGEGAEPVSPMEGLPPTGLSPIAPTVTQPPPIQEPIESVLIPPGEEIPGTINIPGTFSKALRDSIDTFVSNTAIKG